MSSCFQPPKGPKQTLQRGRIANLVMTSTTVGTVIQTLIFHTCVLHCKPWWKSCTIPLGRHQPDVVVVLW